MTLTSIILILKRPQNDLDLNHINTLKQNNLGSNSQNGQFYKSDLDLMTLVLTLDLDMIKMYHHTKNEVSVMAFKSYSLYRHTDRQTHRQYENITFPHTRAVIKQNNYKPVVIFLVSSDVKLTTGPLSLAQKLYCCHWDRLW